MQKQFEQRLSALEQAQRAGNAICLHYVEEARYLLDGVEVDRAVWADAVPMARYVIEVSYADLERPE